ncbi:hypothetical protein BJ508DRAFT_170008 [Ascobolus immersus RN42]|uniref:Uncharacterized protein n=1 Tax=Ascobolus immersus RN42 TaxID=1160509 RepID=A0A3N4HV09_ASCIM|nr:hypothetical protein BJ508DRAFT_170008 [Ascobolus immersus RN42]
MQSTQTIISAADHLKQRAQAPNWAFRDFAPLTVKFTPEIPLIPKPVTLPEALKQMARALMTIPMLIPIMQSPFSPPLIANIDPRISSVGILLNPQLQPLRRLDLDLAVVAERIGRTPRPDFLPRPVVTNRRGVLVHHIDLPFGVAVEAQTGCVGCCRGLVRVLLCGKSGGGDLPSMWMWASHLLGFLRLKRAGEGGGGDTRWAGRVRALGSGTGLLVGAERAPEAARRLNRKRFGMLRFNMIVDTERSMSG